MGGLSASVSKEELTSELEKFGEISDVWVARNPPGFAFIEYNRTSDAEKAVRALDGATICGARVRVEFAHGRSKRAPNQRGRGRGGPRRHEPSPRRGRSPQPFDASRHTFDQFASLYGSDVANAAAAAAAAGFPLDMANYPPMLPFIPPEDIIRTLQNSRRRSPMPLPISRGRSPPQRRRSRSPLNGGYQGRGRDRSPSITYNGRNVDRRFESRGRNGQMNYGRPRVPRSVYSPGPTINGRRDETRYRPARDDKRRR